MTPEEWFEIFRGFPLDKRERGILDELARGATQAKAVALQSRGSARAILFNLIGRGWIIRTERAADFNPETYTITLEGTCARELDQAALEAGYKRLGRGPAGRNAYKNLDQRLATVKISN
jgi:hypothetical protein